MKSWRATCRQCGRPVVRNRAWCSKHLRLVQLGRPTDVENIPSPREGCPPEDYPVLYWPRLDATKTKQPTPHSGEEHGSDPASSATGSGV